MGAKPKKKPIRAKRLAPDGADLEVDTQGLHDANHSAPHLEEFAQYDVTEDDIKNHVRFPDPELMDAPDERDPHLVLRYFYVKIKGIRCRCVAVIETVRWPSNGKPGRVNVATAYPEERPR